MRKLQKESLKAWE